jgi:RNA polymerase sigma factor (sigma-70 family)
MFRESLHDDSGKDLIASLQEGRQEALSRLYDKYASVLLGLITKIIGDKESSEEVFQESFVRIWNQIGSYDANKGSLAFWMLSITREVALDACKSGRFKLPSSNGESSELLTGEVEIDETWKDEDRIKESFTRLDNGGKTVFDLIFLKGYSYGEAAEELGIPIEMVKTTFRVAIKELRAGSEA